MPVYRLHADITTRSTWYAEAEDEESATLTAEDEGVPDRAMVRTLESIVEAWEPAEGEEIPADLLHERAPTTLAAMLSEAERRYLARAIDLGRSDDEARANLSPTERDDLQRRLGGRP